MKAYASLQIIHSDHMLHPAIVYVAEKHRAFNLSETVISACILAEKLFLLVIKLFRASYEEILYIFSFQLFKLVLGIIEIVCSTLFLAMLHSLQDLNSLTRNRIGATEVKAPNPNH